ncbi:protein TAPETUM DETERMINANT 1-like [Coffea arabica]|uniref:Protein TAPETUM DETERMINANT 1-like n=1 Tax=Coffea arabica TaxID=13443 RepID=A0ABM4U1J4_COFAR
MNEFSCSWVKSLKRRRTSVFSATFAVSILFLIIVAFASPRQRSDGLSSNESKSALDGNESRNEGLLSAASSSHRKLLKVQTDSANGVETHRIWGDKCSSSDIVINQGPTAPLPSGIPTYTVEIMNVCVTGCDISGIHLHCGWFSSARLINPHIFKRLRFNDCLVNDGKPLLNGRTISFQYANTFRYPLSVSAVIC